MSQHESVHGSRPAFSLPRRGFIAGTAVTAARKIKLGLIKSFYYGGPFGDPPLTKSIEGRLRSLIWTHTGRHANGLTGPEDPLIVCAKAE